jgi:hypothetical protein
MEIPFEAFFSSLLLLLLFLFAFLRGWSRRGWGTDKRIIEKAMRLQTSARSVETSYANICFARKHRKIENCRRKSRTMAVENVRNSLPQKRVKWKAEDMEVSSAVQDADLMFELSSRSEIRADKTSTFCFLFFYIKRLFSSFYYPGRCEREASLCAFSYLSCCWLI